VSACAACARSGAAARPPWPDCHLAPRRDCDCRRRTFASDTRGASPTGAGQGGGGVLTWSSASPSAATAIDRSVSRRKRPLPWATDCARRLRDQTRTSSGRSTADTGCLSTSQHHPSGLLSMHIASSKGIHSQAGLPSVRLRLRRRLCTARTTRQSSVPTGGPPRPRWWPPLDSPLEWTTLVRCGVLRSSDCGLIDRHLLPSRLPSSSPRS